MNKDIHDLIRLWSEVQKEEEKQEASHLRKKILLAEIGAIYDKKVLVKTSNENV